MGSSHRRRQEHGAYPPGTGWRIERASKDPENYRYVNRNENTPSAISGGVENLENEE